MTHIDPDGLFIQRPEISDRYRCHTSGEIKTIASTWAGGVVFEGGEPCNAMDLITHYDPECTLCGGYHEPEYPHLLSEQFNRYIRQTHGRKATHADATAHCTGLMLAAVTNA